jgi:hypothetical protein
MTERDIENTEDYVTVSTELDARGDAELRNPGSPDLDDEETIDSDLLNGTDTEFGVDDDIDTLALVEEESPGSLRPDESAWNDGDVEEASETAVDDGEFTDEQG